MLTIVNKSSKITLIKLLRILGHLKLNKALDFEIKGKSSSVAICVRLITFSLLILAIKL
jgi:hypothetical protein